MIKNQNRTAYGLKTNGSVFRKWSRLIHRDLSYVFSGILIIYAISGVYMNHRDKVNLHYTVDRKEFVVDKYPMGTQMSKEEIIDILKYSDLQSNYTKHYYPKEDFVKVFIKGCSILEIDQLSGTAVIEILSKRPIVSDMIKLHYNPGKWWTIFSDIFSISMIIVVVTGFTMMKGSKGFFGRGGIEFLIGLLIPILFLWIPK